jgi:hypothetical protein
MRFFFFGSLMDADVRAAVLGPRAARLQIGPARLVGYRRWSVSGGHYPMLLPDGESEVEGVLVDGIGRRDAARLHFFEGSDYAPAIRSIVGSDGVRRTAFVYLSSINLRSDRRAWNFALWQRSYKARFMRRAKSRMARYRLRSEYT